MKDIFTGEYDVTLDEEGCIILPVELIKILGDTELTLKPCVFAECIWLFPTKIYHKILTEYDKNKKLDSAQDTILSRNLSDYQDLKIDEKGSIPIPQTYREYANLTKDCLVVGQVEYIEIWDKEKYRRMYAD